MIACFISGPPLITPFINLSSSTWLTLIARFISGPFSITPSTNFSSLFTGILTLPSGSGLSIPGGYVTSFVGGSLRIGGGG